MKRTRGRPPLDDDDTTTRVSVRLPTRQYDRALSQARADRESVSDLIRRGLRCVAVNPTPISINVRRK